MPCQPSITNQLIGNVMETGSKGAVLQVGLTPEPAKSPRECTRDTCRVEPPLAMLLHDQLLLAWLSGKPGKGQEGQASLPQGLPTWPCNSAHSTIDCLRPHLV